MALAPEEPTMARRTLDTARFTTTIGAGSVLALVAFASMRGGLFTRGAGAEFVRAGLSPMALADGVIDVPGELPTLEAALRQVPDGGTIRLAPGVHLGAVDASGRSVRIEGAGAALCEVRGFGRAPVLSFRGEDSDRVELSGFTVIGGSGAEGCGIAVVGMQIDARDLRVAANEGGGARLVDSRGRFADCIFEGTRTRGSGGAVRAEGCTLDFISCAFTGNVAETFGGAVYGAGGTVAVMSCTLDGNATRSGAWGGAVFGEGAVLELHGSDFARNRSQEAGGAVFVLGGVADVSKCTFESNFSDEGRGIFSRGAGVRIAGSRLCGAFEVALGGDLVAEECNTFDESCFGDCNQNGVTDAEEIERGWATDRDGNGVPDECDPDCNMNGLPDGYEIMAGFAQDMNANGLIDICEIRAGLALDVDGDWIPDDAQGLDWPMPAEDPAADVLPEQWGASDAPMPAPQSPETDPLHWGPGMRSSWMYEQGR
jgi:predicted outer membrane repeat protein